MKKLTLGIIFPLFLVLFGCNTENKEKSPESQNVTLNIFKNKQGHVEYYHTGPCDSCDTEKYQDQAKAISGFFNQNGYLENGDTLHIDVIKRDITVTYEFDKEQLQ